MSIRLVDHVNIVTERLDETRAFFIDALGLTEGRRPPFAVEGYWLYAGERPVVHLQRAVGPIRRGLDGALNHFAFEVSDLAGMTARLEQHGVAYTPAGVPGTEVQQVFLRDPNGVRIELNFTRG